MDVEKRVTMLAELGYVDWSVVARTCLELMPADMIAILSTCEWYECEVSDEELQAELDDEAE